MRPIPVLVAAYGVPKPCGIHPLASVIRGRKHIFGPKEFFGRIEDQNGIVRHGAPVIIQIVWTLGIGVISAAVDGQVSLVINRELILIEMLMFGEVWSAIEFNPGGIWFPAVSNHQMTNSREITLVRQLGF